MSKKKSKGGKFHLASMTSHSRSLCTTAIAMKSLKHSMPAVQNMIDDTNYHLLEALHQMLQYIEHLAWEQR